MTIAVDWDIKHKQTNKQVMWSLSDSVKVKNSVDKSLQNTEICSSQRPRLK